MSSPEPLQRLNLGWFEKIPLRYVIAVLAAITFGYFIQTASPLRLNNDSSRFLAMAESYLRIGELLIFDQRGFLPSGYAAFVTVLDKMGLANAFGLVFANICLLIIGVLTLLSLVNKAYPSQKRLPLLICLLTSTSFVFIKYSPLPQSEILFFALTMLALRCGMEIEGSISRRVLYWVLFAGLSTLSIWVRTVGICLFPAVVIALYPVVSNRPISDLIGRTTWKKFAIFGPALMIVLSGGVYFIVKSSLYWSYLFRGPLSDINLLIPHLSQKMAVFFQLFFNVPSRVISLLSQPVIIIIGGLLLVIVIAGIWHQRKQIGIIEIYIAVSIGALLNWPDFQPRFWMAIIPLLFVFFVHGLNLLLAPKFFSFALNLWVSGFLFFGIISLGYSISLTFADKNFPQLYGDGTLTDTYQAAQNGACPLGLNTSDFLIYKMLIRFDPNMMPPPPKCPQID